ncbi:DUF6879 family protein [Kitasatospora sp. GAS204B]|uniref:DUF6879 family protein n=1 Tax=unclassified Kitasatospora TaxID=2633591 RepID=UPI0024754F47|nr:DUF6879 family protein [Kitasatospora sp. GAS204B]MDH6116416.1 hypothetical protein [Kitasatospora sp. GAS204B]
MSQSAWSFTELVARAQKSAVHLELRDSYGVAEEASEFADWLTGWRPDRENRASWWNDFHQLVSDAVGRGVEFKRARIVSEPVSDYIRYEHSCTFQNLAAGEQVRWLPRRHASDLALPGNDFWLFDEQVVMLNLFTGDGALAGEEVSEDPGLASLCSAAFAAVWDRAVPHDRFEV